MVDKMKSVCKIFHSSKSQQPSSSGVETDCGGESETKSEQVMAGSELNRYTSTRRRSSSSQGEGPSYLQDLVAKDAGHGYSLDSSETVEAHKARN